MIPNVIIVVMMQRTEGGRGGESEKRPRGRPRFLSDIIHDVESKKVLKRE